MSGGSLNKVWRIHWVDLVSINQGKIAEQKALSYLMSQGLKLVAQNFSCRLGEIDLIMRDDEYLVIVEVRSRSSNGYGDGIASITYAKRKKIIKTTSFYLMKHKINEKFPIRFDVVSIDGKKEKITWLKGAFGTE